MPWVPKPDVFPTFSMSMLRQAGLFDADHRGWIGYAFGDVEYIIRLGKLRDVITVVSEQKNGFFFQDIHLSEVYLSLGTRRYLQCISTGRRCEALYLVGNVFASRAYLNKVWGGRKPQAMKDAAHQRGVERLLGTDAKAPARGENRAKLAAQIKPRAWIRIAAPRPRA